MKNMKLYTVALAAVLATGSQLTSCTDMLDEQPRTQLTADYLETGAGLRSAVVSAYSNLRWLYGPDGPLTFSVLGTDEFMHTEQIGSSFKYLDTFTELGAGNVTSTFWDNGLQSVNTCNSVIEYAETCADLEEDERTYLIAQARFLRGLYYYLISMYHGDVPLDLGAGRLKFNLSPSTTSTRVDREEVLGEIINDFDYAAKNLPDQAEAAGRASKGAAFHFLAKAYLTRAGLYSTNRAADYEAAYDNAMEVINNQSKYGTGLTEDFADVNLEGHESDPEVLFTVQRTWSTAGPNMEFEESNDGAFAVTNKGNRANFFFTAGYENVKVAGGIAIVPRSTEYQRPWRMIVPTQWLVEEAFADKQNDARWDGSFRMTWDAGVQFTVKGRTVNVGEKAIEITFDEVTAEPEDSVSESGNGVIYKPYAVYQYKNLYAANGKSLENTVEYMYPNLKKFDDTKRQNMNYDSNRPYIIARLAETYLIAAEAAYYSTSKGGANRAADLINVVRERAAYGSKVAEEDGLSVARAAMRIDADDVDIDFILDERSREFCGESFRYFDLVRTGRYVERVNDHNPFAQGACKDFHALRPIPQTQIDLLSDPAEKASYQNPGY